MENSTKIYFLSSNELPDIPRYVGKTVMTLEHRLKSHVRSVRYRKTHTINWIKKLLLEDKYPIITLIEEVSNDVWAEREIYWINYYRECGHKLTNIVEGGKGCLGYRHTEEHKAKMRKPKIDKRKYKTKEDRFKAHSELIKSYWEQGRISCTITPEQQTLMIQKSTEKSSKVVYEYNSNNTLVHQYKSVSECAKQTGLIGSNIARVCRGVSHHTGHRFFSYELKNSYSAIAP